MLRPVDRLPTMVACQKKLISLRKSMGLSQEELGAELKVSRQTISKWESGVSQS